MEMASGSLNLVPDSLDDVQYQLFHALKKAEDDVKNDRKKIELVVEEEVGAY